MVAAITIALAGSACGGTDISRQLGARCTTTSDCDDRCLSEQGDYPGGFCTVDCSINDDCPNDSACADREGGVCLFTCRNDAECTFLGAGWSCHDEELHEPPHAPVRVCRG